MEFCPTCGTMLQYEPPNMGNKARLFCPTCPYACQIENQIKIKKRQRLVKKPIEPIFSGEDAMKFAPKTEATCPSCNHGQAYYRQLQIRSADEPMSTFYQCCNDNCRREWRED
ncbi:zinc finger protein [Macleaya cordata]|uniref:DNA-directed RNA polymerase subunit n=1 Tax=Macleaya cordata TaxID=56857 RepID=A0A200PTD3_MACCD|nr:zinc finger protein [Macleaya cordata]